MREILFRAYDKTMKRYKPFDGEHDTMLISCDGKVDYYNLQNGSGGDEYILEQFTGLTDKNGKKIFEGDIVRFIWWWFDGAERESELTGTIVYSSDNMSFQLKGVKNKEWRDFVGADEHDMDYLTPFSELNFCDADFEVIGNIHDNPELLGGANE